MLNPKASGSMLDGGLNAKRIEIRIPPCIISMSLYCLNAKRIEMINPQLRLVIPSLLSQCKED